MSYANFQPRVWATKMLSDIDQVSVFKGDCNRDHEGEVKNHGDSVKINGIGTPTIYGTSDKSMFDDLLTRQAEVVSDLSATLIIKQLRYFNFKVPDIDEAQMKGNLIDKLTKKAAVGIADHQDKYIASFAADSSVQRIFGATPMKVVAGTAGNGEINVLDAFDEAITQLYKNGVPKTEEKIITISPDFHKLLKKAYILTDTNNSALMKNGYVGMYGDVKVKMSNNVYTEKGADGKITEFISLRTPNAWAFVDAINKLEPYRPEAGFSDAIKGFSLFDGKVVLPKECVTLNVTY